MPCWGNYGEPPPPWFWAKYYGHVYNQPSGYNYSPYLNYSESPPAWLTDPPPVIPDEDRQPATYSSQLLPTVNPFLAADTISKDLIWDMQYPPSTEIATHFWSRFSSTQVLSHATSEICLFIKGTPWSLTIHPDSRGVVTIAKLLQSIWNTLQAPIDDTEWGFIVKDEDRRRRVMKNGAKRKANEHTSASWYKKIDYLGDKESMFLGLVPDPRFQAVRMCPGIPYGRDTFVVKLGKQKDYASR